MLVDTGSSWTWVATDDCMENCKDSRVFHANASESLTHSTQSYDIKYGSGTIKGEMVNDQVGLLENDASTSSFPFLAVPTRVDHSTELMTGILGLAPGDKDSNPLFVDYLFTAGKIKKKEFSILLNPKIDGESFISFGGLPTGYTTEGMSCHKITGSYHWEMKLNALAYKG